MGEDIMEDKVRDESEGAGLPWVWAPEYLVDIGPHVFPTVKYQRIKEMLLREGTLRSKDLHRPDPASRTSLARVHSSDYVEKVMTGAFSPADEARLELPFTPELRRAYLLCCGGTALVGRLALETRRVAVHIGGGFHHAFAKHGEGFCLLNDVAVGVQELRAEGRVRRVAVVDLDLHHGNGTAAIFGDEPDVFTFSMHEEQNYPLVKPPSDLDVGLEYGVDDERYLALLQANLPRVLTVTGPISSTTWRGPTPSGRTNSAGSGSPWKGCGRGTDSSSACAESGRFLWQPSAQEDTLAASRIPSRSTAVRFGKPGRSSSEPDRGVHGAGHGRSLRDRLPGGIAPSGSGTGEAGGLGSRRGGAGPGGGRVEEPRPQGECAGPHAPGSGGPPRDGGPGEGSHRERLLRRRDGLDPRDVRLLRQQVGAGGLVRLPAPRD